MSKAAKTAAVCDVFGADDPRDFSVSFQNFLSWWHRELGNKLKATASACKVVRFPAFSYENWTILKSLIQLARVRGDTQARVRGIDCQRRKAWRERTKEKRGAKTRKPL